MGKNLDMKKSDGNLSEHTETYFSKIEDKLGQDLLNSVLNCDVGTQNLSNLTDSAAEQSEKV